MVVGVLFWLLAFTCCAYAALFGGRDGRWATLMIFGASLATILAARLGPHWTHTEWPRFGVDFSLLVGFYLLMLQSRRYWTIWVVGFHLIATTTHASTIIAPGFTPAIYRAMQSFWAIPVLLTLMVGIALDRRAESTRRGSAASTLKRGSLELVSTVD